MGRHAAPKQPRPEVRGLHRKPNESLGLRKRLSTKTGRRLGAAALAISVGLSAGQVFSTEKPESITAAPYVAESLTEAKSTEQAKKLGGLASWKRWSRSASREPLTTPIPTATPITDTLTTQAAETDYEEPRPERGYDPVYHEDKLFDEYTVELLERFEEGMEEAGLPLTRYTQGSFSTRNASSGSTHAGGGAVDYSINQMGGAYSDYAYETLREFREAGFAAWIRVAGEAGSAAHIHAIAIGNESASEAAKEQVEDYLNGRNGLVNNAPDRYAESVGQPNPEWVEELKPELL